VAMFGIFMLLYWNMYSRRSSLQLSERQAFEAWAGLRTHAMSAGVGLVSVLLALTVPIQWIWTAGAIYGLQGPIHWRNGVLIEQARLKAFPPPAADRLESGPDLAKR
jgi:multisubunit Na+/H+ antiporter MnhB subunit